MPCTVVFFLGPDLSESTRCQFSTPISDHEAFLGGGSIDLTTDIAKAYIFDIETSQYTPIADLPYKSSCTTFMAFKGTKRQKEKMM